VITLIKTNTTKIFP